MTNYIGGVQGQVLQIITANDNGICCCTGVSLRNNACAGIQKSMTSSNVLIDGNQGLTNVFDGTYWRISKLH